MTVSWLEHIDYLDLRNATVAVLFTGGLLAVAGLGLGRRRLLECGFATVAWTVATVVANFAQVAVLESYTHHSPHFPHFSVAPQLGFALLLSGAVWGAVALRWRPWSGVWLASAVAAMFASSVVAWAHLDRTVVYPEAGYPTCLGLKFSQADVAWLGPLWFAVAIGVGVAATLAHAAAPHVPTRVLRVAADALLVITLAAVGVAAVRVAARPQPQDYAMSLPALASAREERLATYEEMGFSQAEIAQWTRDRGEPPARDRRMTILGRLPHDLRYLLVHDGYRRPHVAWVWADGSRDMTHNAFDHGAALDLRHDASADIWLVMVADKVLAAPHSSRSEAHDWRDREAGRVASRRHYLAWDLIASRIAPPMSWVLAAALGALAAFALRATSSKSDEGKRTLTAMRIALLCASSTPLLVAAVRGFVFAW